MTTNRRIGLQRLRPSSVLRLGILLLAMLAVPGGGAWAQLCVNTAPLAQYDFASAALTGLVESPDAARISLSEGSTLRSVNLDLTGVAQSVSLSDGAVGASYATTVGPYTNAELFVAEENAHVEAVDSVGVFWWRLLARSSCGNDMAAADPPAYHLRSAATPAFQLEYAGDLVYVGTAYRYDGSSGCSGDYRTDNRVYAMHAADGSIAWVFNGGATLDVDAVAGLVLDPSTDRLYATSERTFSSTQHSVWALDVLTGAKAWSVNAGRIQVPPVLFQGRLYVATMAGEIKALDPATGAEHWSFVGGAPIAAPAELLTFETEGGDLLLATVDLFGQLRVVRDDDTAGTAVSWFRLPNGDPGAVGLPSVKAASRIVADATGKGLVGADDGKVYPIDLLAGTVGTPVVVDSPTESVNHLVLEPPRVFGFPASFLAATTDGLLARYCTTLGAAEAVPSTNGGARALLALALAVVGALTRRRHA